MDNASSDNSLATARQAAPEASFLALEENIGFCRANNIAIEAVSSELIALLNNDTEAEPGWLQSLVEALDDDRQAGFCASRMIRIDDRVSLDSAGDIFYTHGVAAKRGEGRPATQFATAGYVFGACAGAALYRRALFDAVGTLDDEFGSMDEDVDLSFRAQLAGFKCRYVPNAVVFHHVGAAFNRVPEARVRLARRNIVTILLKNMPRPLLVRRGWLMALYVIAGDIRWSARGFAKAVFSARMDNVRSLRRVLDQRRQIQSARKVAIHDLEASFTRSSLINFASRLRPTRRQSVQPA